MPEETPLTYEVMLELRPRIGTKDDFGKSMRSSEPRGRLVASFDEGAARPAAVAGFRTGTSLVEGHYLYVDGLVTAESARKLGHAQALIEWMLAEAKRLGCRVYHLDSATRRHEAHRFYLKNGFVFSAFHFEQPVR